MRNESAQEFVETPEQYEARMKWLGDKFEERVRRDYEQQKAERSVAFRLWLGMRDFAKTLQNVFVRSRNKLVVKRVQK